MPGPRCERRDGKSRGGGWGQQGGVGIHRIRPCCPALGNGEGRGLPGCTEKLIIPQESQRRVPALQRAQVAILDRESAPVNRDVTTAVAR